MIRLLIPICFLALGLFACPTAEPDSQARASCAQRTVRLSSTTSVDNTGLLKDILTPFTERTGIKVHVLAVGTGKALKLAENGDVDAVFVHDRHAEQAFMDAGFGVHRTGVMHNDFVIVGPETDPAKISGQALKDALARIVESESTFVSRGDESGTHKAEQRLWKGAALKPGGDWYVESGQGQRLNLNMADEKQAYCFIDRATYLSAQDKVSLKVLVEGDSRLHNPYSVMAVNPARHKSAKFVEAMALIGWLTSVECQNRIGAFKVVDKQLFYPDALGQK